MNSASLPTKIALADPQTLRIVWSDGRTLEYSVHALRDACPCATCREKKAAPPAANPLSLNVLSPAEARPLRLLDMQPIGNYAYGLQFSDGHSSGIYTLEMLRKLGREVEGPGESGGQPSVG